MSIHIQQQNGNYGRDESLNGTYDEYTGIAETFGTMSQGKLSPMTGL